jgi:hypothetical protein
MTAEAGSWRDCEINKLAPDLALENTSPSFGKGGNKHMDRADATTPSSPVNLSVMIPLLTAIVAGLIALLSNIYATYLNSDNQIQLERQRLKANLILEAVKTGDREKAVKNLSFFLEAGFIEDKDGNIAALVAKNNLPVLPAFSEIKSLIDQLSKSQAESSKLFDEMNKKSLEAIRKIKKG